MHIWRHIMGCLELTSGMAGVRDKDEVRKLTGRSEPHVITVEIHLWGFGTMMTTNVSYILSTSLQSCYEHLVLMNYVMTWFRWLKRFCDIEFFVILAHRISPHKGETRPNPQHGGSAALQPRKVYRFIDTAGIKKLGPGRNPWEVVGSQ